MLAKSKNVVLTTWYYSTRHRLLRFISLRSGYSPWVFRPPLFDNTKLEHLTERPLVTTKLIQSRTYTGPKLHPKARQRTVTAKMGMLQHCLPAMQFILLISIARQIYFF